MHLYWIYLPVCHTPPLFVQCVAAASVILTVSQRNTLPSFCQDFTKYRLFKILSLARCPGNWQKPSFLAT